ncbi:MAG: S-layer protein [Methylobacillus sp.]|jgi:probable H4MPT-linked C1 transfer pathway protein|nr:S-layer protein [Methylobacillus sp.]
MNNCVLGWDVGGAHLKAVLVQSDGRAVQAVQRMCPLWRGMDKLQQAVTEILDILPAHVTHHAITMTGELADIFPDRQTGVTRITEHMHGWLKNADIAIYAGAQGFLAPDAVGSHANIIASANWHASAEFLARRCGTALFMDVGSTTTDLVVLHSGKPLIRGYSDAERMATEELVYTGVIRTPVMAVARRLPFAGGWQQLAAEHFATMADVYRLTGELFEECDMGDTADRQGKSEHESARRLARMMGRDFSDADMAQWRQLARTLRSRQLWMLQSAVERQLSRRSFPDDAPIIGAGAGAFLVRELARVMNHPFIDVAQQIEGDSPITKWASVCLPAYAVAWLRARELA